MSTTVVDIAKLTREEAMRLASKEYGRMSDLLGTLAGEEWDEATDCVRWTVKDIVAHIVGINEGVLNPLEMSRQQRAGKPYRAEGLSKFDAANEAAVVERRGMSTAELVAAYGALVPRILRRRTRLPGLVRAVPISDGMGGRFKLGYLMEVILTRDIWMHRVDISRATGRDLVLTPDHDGRIVADVVRDWAARHHKPFTLELSGPAGGSYRQGTGGEEHQLDAVDFCRVLSGRGSGTGLLTTFVPF